MKNILMGLLLCALPATANWEYSYDDGFHIAARADGDSSLAVKCDYMASFLSVEISELHVSMDFGNNNNPPPNLVDFKQVALTDGHAEELAKCILQKDYMELNVNYIGMEIKRRFYLEGDKQAVRDVMKLCGVSESGHVCY